MLLLQRLLIVTLVFLDTNQAVAADAETCHQELNAEKNRLEVNRSYLLTKFDSVEDTADYMNAMMRGVCRKHCQDVVLPNGEAADCFRSVHAFVEGQRLIGILETAPKTRSPKLVRVERMPASNY